MLKEEDIELVKDSVSMRDLCDRYGLKVNRAGFISCPFHGSDKHPSMKIYPGRRGYHCFTCGEGGDVISFAMKYTGTEFEPAVRHIAEMFGIPITDGNRQLTEQEKKAIADQRAKREQAELEKHRNKARLAELSELLKVYEAYIDIAEPMSSLWWTLMQRKQILSEEWDRRFERE